MKKKYFKLSEIADVLMGQSPPGSSYNVGREGMPLLNGPTEFGTYHPTPKTWTTKITKICQQGDLLFCVRGSTTGRMNWADQSYCLGRGLCAIKGKSDEIDTKFTFYSILANFSELLAIANGSVFPNLSHTDIKNFEIFIPELSIRKKAVQILDSLDKKIILLGNKNKSLEKIVESIFKSWFIDFDGQEEFVDSELGQIPKGWKVGEISDAVTIFDYKRVPLSELEREKRPGIFPYYGASGIIDYIDDYLFDGEYLLASEDGENLRSRKTPIIFFAVGKFWVNNHAHILQGKNNFSNNFLWILFKNLDLAPWITGAVQPKLNQENLLSIPIIIPEKEILLKFNSITKIMSESIHKNLMLMDILTKIRDSLLPKLMSGEISV